MWYEKTYIRSDNTLSQLNLSSQVVLIIQIFIRDQVKLEYVQRSRYYHTFNKNVKLKCIHVS